MITSSVHTAARPTRNRLSSALSTRDRRGLRGGRRRGGRRRACGFGFGGVLGLGGALGFGGVLGFGWACALGLGGGLGLAWALGCGFGRAGGVDLGGAPRDP